MAELLIVNETIRRNIHLDHNVVEVETREFLEFENMIHIKSVIAINPEIQQNLILDNNKNRFESAGIASRKHLEYVFDKSVKLELLVKLNID